MTKARDFEAQVKDTDAELQAIAKAEKILKETMGGAASLAQDGADSFLQVALRSKAKAGTKLAGLSVKAVRILRDLAWAKKSTALAQLAQRVDSALTHGEGRGRGPFDSVKRMIEDMMAKIENELAQDAKQKAYCDKEMAQSTARKEDKDKEVSKLSTKISQSAATVARLEEQVGKIMNELGEMTSGQAEMDRMRQNEKSQFEAIKGETEIGLDGVKRALKVLRDYYAAGDDDGKGSAGGGILSMLEVVESDLSKSLADMIAKEEEDQREYDKETNENRMQSEMMRQDA